jgi:hypothetical protein
MIAERMPQRRFWRALAMSAGLESLHLVFRDQAAQAAESQVSSAAGLALLARQGLDRS